MTVKPKLDERTGTKSFKIGTKLDALSAQHSQMWRGVQTHLAAYYAALYYEQQSRKKALPAGGNAF